MALSNLAENLEIRVLIVEDNDRFRQAFIDNLQRVSPGLLIQEAIEGKECLEKVEAFRPQLVFMDIRLPGENGLSLTKKIKAGYPEMLVVVLTSYDNPEYRDAALQSGASRFVSKDTLNFEEMAALIRSI
jgi:DNA-binding NarL/FixJ family response regulator